jgi:2,5-diketo-D-gluconate reductase B
VSNFTPELLDEAKAETDNAITANQIEIHPLLQQEELQTYATENDLTLVAYAPLAQGNVFDVPTIVDIAEKHGVSAAQVGLAWLVEKEVVPIPKATGDHILDNYGTLELEPDPEDITRIDSIEEEIRVVNPEDESRVDLTPWS